MISERWEDRLLGAWPKALVGAILCWVAYQVGKMLVWCW